MLFRRETATISKFASSVRAVVAGAAQIALCLTSGVSGGVQLSVDPATLTSMGVTWATDSPAWFVRVVGTAELAGAIGIAAASLTGVMSHLPILSAASLIGADMLAMSIHSCWSALAPPAPLDLASLVLSVVVLWTSQKGLPVCERSVTLPSRQKSKPETRP